MTVIRQFRDRTKGILDTYPGNSSAYDHDPQDEQRQTAERRVEGFDLLTQARKLIAERVKREASTRGDAVKVAGGLDPPLEMAANVEWRAELRRKADQSVAVRLAVRNRCRASVEYFAAAVGWTYDPRPGAVPNHFPFLLWDYERDFLATIEEQYRAGKDLLVEKSRDMGATWCVLLWVLWHWQYDAAFSAHLGSRKEDFVDKRGDVASHFGKLRYMLERMPSWAQPTGFDWRTHDLNMRLLNPENGNVITGEAANPDFSRQGRYSMVFCDEFASVACDEEVAMATSESTTTRLFVSTPKGARGAFYRMRHSGKIRVVTLHWTMHPQKRNTTLAYLDAMVETGRARRDEQDGVSAGLYRETGTTNEKGKAVPGKLRSSWYDERCNGEEPRVIAQELDIAYIGSGNAVLDLEVVKRWHEGLLRLSGSARLRQAQGGTWEFYEELLPEGQYVVGVDTAKGTGRDWSTIEVFRYPQMAQVAEMRAQMPPDLLGPEAVEVAHKFNDGLLVVENDGMGLATCYAARDHLAARGYRLKMYHYVDYRKPNSEPAELGLSTGKCRAEMIRRLMGAVRQEQIEIRSLRWIEEAYAFEWVSSDRAEASGNNHDDLMMATAFTLYAVLSWDKWVDVPLAWWL